MWPSCTAFFSESIADALQSKRRTLRLEKEWNVMYVSVSLGMKPVQAERRNNKNRGGRPSANVPE